jgi:UDP-GlcNAc:undecaprenyl-phosphate GlcNAc-1-phosphate transferase
MNWHIFAFIAALLISLYTTPLVRKLALRLNILVHPGGRRVHTQPTPLWGGIAIYVAFAIPCLIGIILAPTELNLGTPTIGILVAGAFILTIGLLDDVKELSAATQMSGILFAGILLMAFRIKIDGLTHPFKEAAWIPLSGFVSWIITLAWIFCLTKTVDFMDGLDGLAAGIGAIAAGVIAIMAYYDAQPHVALMAASLSGACVGFLRFNFNPAKIFMGTGGSQFIGLTLAALSIIGLFKVATAMAIALPILVFGVPIFDGVFVVIKRLINRRPVHVADQTHLHHRLLKRGLTHRQAVIAIYGICILLACTAIILWLRY